MLTTEQRLLANIQFFSGCCESEFSPDEHADTDSNGEAIDSGSIDSLDGYIECLGKLYVEALTVRVLDREQFELISFESISSPREYNFETDRLFVYIDSDLLTTMARKIYTDVAMRVSFAGYLKQLFTSRSGFIPSYSDDLAEWESAFSSDGLADCDHNTCGTYLSFYLLWEFDSNSKDAASDLEWDVYYTIDEALDEYVQGHWEYEDKELVDAIYAADHAHWNKMRDGTQLALLQLPATCDIFAIETIGAHGTPELLGFKNEDYLLDLYSRMLTHLNSLDDDSKLPDHKITVNPDSFTLVN